MENANTTQSTPPNQNNKQERRSPDRKVDLLIKSSTSNLAIEVLRIFGFRPRFRWMLGRMMEDGRFYAGMSIRSKEEHYKVEIEKTNTEEVVQLILKAEEHILNEKQKREDEIFAHDERKEKKRLGIQEKQKHVRSPGKTQREKENGKWKAHQENLMRRSDEDRERTQNAGKR